MGERVTLSVTRAVWVDCWSWAEDAQIEFDEDFEIEEQSRRYRVTMSVAAAEDFRNHIDYVAAECRGGGYGCGGPAMARAYYAAQRSLDKQFDNLSAIV